MIFKKIQQYINLWVFRYGGRLKVRLGFKVQQFTADRKILESVIFPYIKRNHESLVLFVGVDFYTKHYQEEFHKDAFWTIDFDSRLRSFGAKHHICDRYENIELHLSSEKFDYIICNGLIGYGTNSIDDLNSVIETSYRILKNSGTLIIGWNNRPESNQFDPRNSHALKLFSEFVFPPLNVSRFECSEGSSHVYDFYKKNNNIS